VACQRSWLLPVAPKPRIMLPLAVGNHFLPHFKLPLPVNLLPLPVTVHAQLEAYYENFMELSPYAVWFDF
jgi:hypothetical protein